jgi:arylsulfatase A-like enzyme
VGPHAPHLPSTPAEWYLHHPVGELPVVKEPNYGVLGSDKHAFYPAEPTIDSADAAAIQSEYADRMRSLLSVDDIIRGLREYLVSVSEWDNTVLIFTSDHGYTLGVCSSYLPVSQHPFATNGR